MVLNMLNNYKILFDPNDNLFKKISIIIIIFFIFRVSSHKNYNCKKEKTKISLIKVFVLTSDCVFL